MLSENTLADALTKLEGKDPLRTANDWTDALVNYSAGVVGVLYTNGAPSPTPVPAIPGAFQLSRMNLYGAILPSFLSPGSPNTFGTALESGLTALWMAVAPTCWVGYSAGVAPIAGSLVSGMSIAMGVNLATGATKEEGAARIAKAIHDYVSQFKNLPVTTGATVFTVTFS